MYTSLGGINMSVLTIHALDSNVEKRVRSKARKENKSLNRVLKELLAESVGMSAVTAPDHRADFEEFAGVWSNQDEREFNAVTADLERIDAEDWK
jgi:hypothetical protein